MQRKRAKKLIYILLILFVLGVSGCMFQGEGGNSNALANESEIKEKIEIYLGQKYATTISVEELFREFNGQDGVYYRGICTCAGYSDTFTVFCYEGTSDKPVAFSIGNEKYSLLDQYAEVVLQNELLLDLAEYDHENVFIGCKISFNTEQPTAEMLKTDIAGCLNGADAYLKVYIVSGGADVQNLYQRAAQLMETYNPYRGYIYVATKVPFDEAEVAQIYSENQHDYGNYLNNTDYADRVEFTLYKGGEGLQPSDVVKE